MGWLGNRCLHIALLVLVVAGALTLSGCSRGDGAGADFTTAVLAADAQGDVSLASSDPDRGRQLFASTCASCHGASAQGLPHQGVNLRTSKFIASHSDDQLVIFIRAGRTPGDPTTIEGLQMPSRGGNPQLDDDSLRDIVAYLRAIQKGFVTRAASAVP